jgi:hypothetical protein
MKKLILIISILVITGTLFAGSKPPKAVQNAFNEKFPAVSNLKWSEENDNEWEANFKLDGINTSANFSNDGAWLETETEIPVSQLPEKITSAINAGYAGYKIVGAAKIEKVTGEITYEADIKSGKKKKELIYREDGTIAK